MQDQVWLKTEKLLRAKRRRHRWKIAMLAFFALVIGSAAVVLTTPEKVDPELPFACGTAAHTHSAAAGCYAPDGTLTCVLPEHVHTEYCAPAAPQTASTAPAGDLFPAATASAQEPARHTAAADGIEDAYSAPTTAWEEIDTPAPAPAEAEAIRTEGPQTAAPKMKPTAPAEELTPLMSGLRQKREQRRAARAEKADKGAALAVFRMEQTPAAGKKHAAAEETVTALASRPGTVRISSKTPGLLKSAAAFFRRIDAAVTEKLKAWLPPIPEAPELMRRPAVPDAAGVPPLFSFRAPGWLFLFILITADVSLRYGKETKYKRERSRRRTP